ncbi:MAG: putative toxin-antitoxin system toxin component, PIN family [Eubacteriales bacterium]
MNKLIKKIIEEHNLVISSFVLEELNEVVKRKFPKQLTALDKFLTALSFQLIYSPKTPEDSNLFYIRDKKDYMVLYTAIIEDVDIFITGDKDFKDVAVDRPEILTLSEFLEKY